jgi:formylglycine-generating enzyme required for sulfatase activity
MLAYYEQAAIPAGTEPDFLTEARRRRKLRKQLTAALAAIAAIAVLFLLNRVRRQENYLQALAAYQTAEGASREAETLWPAGTGYADRMKQWVEKASRLSAAAPRYKALLATLAADDQHRDEIARLIEILQGFGNSERGEISAIQRRLERASRIVSDPDLASRWKAAMAAVASNPRYSGLQLQPQFGLSPLGMDRHSGLEEFADWRTGEAPARGGNGELQIDENSALIFVLVPGGTFRMGEEHGNPADQYDRPLAYEGPVNSVTLSPFFISKYEMSQGQWLRVTGTNPSKYNPQNGAAYRITLLNPVEQVSWNDCDLLFSHLHLAIPTEAQWEYATRGGTTTPWWTGATSASLDGKANVDGTRDGYEKHAPINAFPPNPFGLYNVHGNVWEWCRDFYSTTSYRYPVRPGDGLRMLTGDQRVFRGGGYDDNANFSRSSYRYGYKPNFNFDVAGVRPSREIQPD